MLFRSNRTSEGYFANKEGWMMPGIMDQIAYPVGAAKAFERLISDNKNLLENKVDISIVEKFIELIINKGPEKRLISFFSAICTCQGENVLSNQEICRDRIFDPKSKSKVLLSITESTAGQPRAPVIHSEESDRPDTYLGKAQLTGGYKSVRISWDQVPKLRTLR